MPRACDTRESARMLLELIRESLRAGHRRVAIQRIFMLRHLDGDLPDDLAAVLTDVVPRLNARELRRMQQAADDWVSMLRTRPW